MSAAVLRPNLFDHLFASRPSRDQNSISATLYSVGIHASLILLAAWLSVALDPMPGKPTDDSVTPIYIAIPPQLITEPAGASPEGSGSSAPVYVVPSVPIPGMPDLPAQRTAEFAQPGTPTAEPARSNEQSGGSNESAGIARSDGFRVLSIAPAIMNEQQVKQALVRSYPGILRDAGIGGLAIVWVLIDEDGRVVRSELKESSGYPALDEAALEVAPIMRFSPAMNRDQRVKVWVSIPVRFRAD